MPEQDAATGVPGSQDDLSGLESAFQSVLDGATPLTITAIPERVLEVIAELRRLRAAIAKHHSQKADDRCWLDDCDLYLAAGLPVHDARVGDRAAMLANCKRFIERRCGGGGPWKSYAELEAENAALRAQVAEERERCAKAAEGFVARPCGCGNCQCDPRGGHTSHDTPEHIAAAIRSLK